jgi:hypothetical protein
MTAWGILLCLQVRFFHGSLLLTEPLFVATNITNTVLFRQENQLIQTSGYPASILDFTL